MIKKKESTPKKVVFVVINLANEPEQRKNTAKYAAELAKQLGLGLVVHPKYEGTEYPFLAAYKKVYRMMRTLHVRCRMSKEQTSFFTSINTIARKQNAASIVIGVSESLKKAREQKEFSRDMWNVANDASIPIFLVGKEVAFDPFSEITIAVDSSRRIQKVNFLKWLVTEVTMVNVFIEKANDLKKKQEIETTLRQILSYLSVQKISYKTEIAREETDYAEHLMRFAASRSKLLIIEVEGTIDSDLKKNLQKVLFSKNQRFAVMLIRSKDVTISRWL
ncbi:MAG: hypothetical protein WCG98_07620 [bacterium]